VSQERKLEALRALWQQRNLDAGWAAYTAGQDCSDPEWHLLGGYFAWAKRDVYRARAILERILPIAETGPAYLRQRVRYALAEVYRCIGDHHLACIYLRTLLAEGNVLPDMEAMTWYTLGLTHYSRNEWDDAIQAEARAIAMFRDLNYPEYLRKALHNHAWTLTLLGRTDEARTCLEEARPLAENTPAPGRWANEIGWAHLALAEGRPTDALDIVTGVIRAADHDTIPDDICSRAAWIGGRAQLALGHVYEAEMLADASLRWGMEANDVRCINDALALLREARAKRRDHRA
jgi:tetratricopeptide (TPR) repeat protein